MIDYEWCREEIDEHGDIIENHFSPSLRALADTEGDLVLVYTQGNDKQGITDRAWAYISAGKLPDNFTDSYGRVVAMIPHRFHIELAKYNADLSQSKPRT